MSKLAFPAPSRIKQVFWPSITGRCSGSENPNLWSPETEQELQQALSVCRECSILSTCLGAGVKNKETGVWGGQYLYLGKPTKPKFGDRGRPRGDKGKPRRKTPLQLAKQKQRQVDKSA